MCWVACVMLANLCALGVGATHSVFQFRNFFVEKRGVGNLKYLLC